MTQNLSILCPLMSLWNYCQEVVHSQAIASSVRLWSVAVLRETQAGACLQCTDGGLFLCLAQTAFVRKGPDFCRTLFLLGLGTPSSSSASANARENSTRAVFPPYSYGNMGSLCSL